jgi:hypothetical protein
MIRSAADDLGLTRTADTCFAGQPGTGPALRPNAVRSASRCGTGSRPARSSTGASSWCSPANASSISDCTPAARNTRHPAACPAR